MIFLFAHVYHDNNKVKSCIILAQYHDNINKIENSSKKWNRQNNINEIRDFLKILWNNTHNTNNILIKLRNIIIKEEY